MAQDGSATSLPSLPATLTSLNTSNNTATATSNNNHNNNGTGGGSSPTNNSANSSSAVSALPSSLAAAIPLAQLLSKPGALNALTSLSALGGLTDLLGGLANLTGPPVQTTGAHRAKPSINARGTRGTGAPYENQSNPKKFNERNKFNPY